MLKHTIFIAILSLTASSWKLSDGSLVSSMAQCIPDDLADLRALQCNSKYWSMTSSSYTGMRSSCSEMGSSVEGTISECKAIACSRGADTFDYDVSLKTCTFHLCSGSTAMVAASGFEVYQTVDTAPVVIMADISNSGCPSGQGKIYMVKDATNCTYKGPCDTASIVIANLPTSQTDITIGKCIPLSIASANWLRGPVNITSGVWCTNSSMSCIPTPEQVRLNLAKPEGNAYTVEWATNAPGEAIIRYSTDINALLSGSSGVSTAYGSNTKYTICGGDCGDDYNQAYCSPNLHYATISDLTPNGATYYYQVGSPTDEYGSSSLSTIKEFQTVSTIEDPNKYPQHILVLGDMGQTVHSEATCIEVQNDTDLEFGVLVGDMSYSDGYGPRWDSWGKLVENCFSELPMLYLPGNHEVEWEAGIGVAFRGYRQRFHMPENLPGQYSYIPGDFGYKYFYGNHEYDYGSAYYSIDVGPTHNIILSSYSASNKFSKQYKWVLGDFDSIDRSKTPWVFVYMHGPIYNSNAKHQMEKGAEEIKTHMEDLFLKYKVDAVFSGHVHAYERFNRTYKSKYNKDGPYYVTIGDAGNREKLYDVWPVDIETTLYQNGMFYGSGRMTVMNTTHTLWEWEPNAADGPYDVAWFVKEDASSSSGSDNGDSGNTNMTVVAVVVPVVVLTLMAVAFFCYRRRKVAYFKRYEIYRMNPRTGASNRSIGKPFNDEKEESVSKTGVGGPSIIEAEQEIGAVKV
mmetsp:Transcript_18723/g.28031  ORF Transcript_18723/g.28031 Transcript_18723/m.28031 type:complete len:741 (+) Transcript_18723:85-2307(+)